MADTHNTRRRFLQTAGIAVGSTVLLGTASASHEETWTFHAELTGEDHGVETPASGHATFEIPPDSHEIQYTIDVSHLCHTTQAHVHLGEETEDGPVVSWLYPEDGTEPELLEGRFDGTLAKGTISLSDLVGPLEGADSNEVATTLMEEDAYVNVHTETHPAGEIRGQIRPDADTEEAITEAMDDDEDDAPMEGGEGSEEGDDGNDTDDDQDDASGDDEAETDDGESDDGTMNGTDSDDGMMNETNGTNETGNGSDDGDDTSSIRGFFGSIRALFA
ncbi:CHRD domain-containing protein [Saliphagus infecundisoli]|uniref:CHRD domain-containing protein n=1 Tax=Saliphagus infecundisoli TaxID=1849069 RepID=A0ABD5QHE2_9EURY|nr:CHRD domain-containing protein [Saliphagus infecundisoli]